ncbi:hypothetical protein [Bradyrhizobium sp. USDA 4502]
MKAKWLDPEYRAKMEERDSRREELRKADPERFTRTGIPNGMRRDEADRMWSVADAQADKVIQTLKADGLLPETGTATTATAQSNIPVPDTDEGMAEVVLREAFKLALGPTGKRAKLQALDIILKYTRLKPMSVLKLATGAAESALDEMTAP